MSNKYIVPIGVLVAAILIIVGGYIMLNPQPPSQPDVPNNESYIEPVEEEYGEMPKIKVTEDALEQNANVPFKVGDKYQYRTMTQHRHEYVECKNEISQREYNRRMEEYYRKMMEGKNITEPELPVGCERKNKTTTTSVVIEYKVETTEKAEGKECYVVVAKRKRDIEEIKREIREYMQTASEEEIEKVAREQKAMMEQENITYYYDKKTGKVMKVVIRWGGMEMTFTKDYGKFMEGFGMMGVYPPLSRWMLALHENFRWIQKIDIEEAGRKGMMEIEYKVIGIEKVNNRECFKVEMIMKEISGELAAFIPTEGKNFMWVDKEKRILIKTQTNVEGLTVAETNLIYGL